jgi:hypothetical protein
MNFEDLKWAFRELMKPPRHRLGCGCELHADTGFPKPTWACTPAGGESAQVGSAATESDEKRYPE